MTTPVETTTKPAAPLNPAVEKLNEKKRATLSFIYTFQIIQKVQVFWKVILVAASIVSAVLFKNMYVFQTHQYYKDIRKGHFIDLAWGLLIAIAFYFVEKALKGYFKDFVTHKWIRQDKYTEIESRTRRIQLMSKWIYTIPYYLINTCIAYYLLKDTDALPTWLGGSGRCANLYLHAPYVAAETFGIRIFYLVAFGKSLSHCVAHMFIKPEGNFFEYALHHGITTFLIVFSYLMNFWTAGILILMIHDLSDAVLALARLYGDYKYKRKWVVDVIYGCTVISWIGCRIIIHTSCCVFPIWQTVQTKVAEWTEFQLSVMLAPGLFMGSMVVILEILHLFWTYFIFSLFFVTSVNKKAKMGEYET